MTHGAKLLIILTWMIVATTASAETHKFAVVLGNNKGHDDSQDLRYATRDAQKVHNVPVELGGFPRNDTVLLLDADAATAQKALKNTERKISKRAAQTGDKTLLLVYYSGHAEGDTLELGKTSLRFEQLRRFLEDSEADVRLAFLDSCMSGKLISTKGGRRGPGYAISVTDEISSNGYAIITSSAHNELSQESAELRGAFFTHYLVSALRGAGDESGDGRVTLSEAYQYAYTRTLARTSATIGGGQHPMYYFQLKGRGEIVLTNTDRTGSTMSIGISEPGRLVLLDESGDNILAETNITGDETALLSVAPGSYLIYLVTPSGAVRSAQADLSPGSSVELGPDDFQTTILETGISKGGLFKTPEGGWTHRVGAGGLWRLWPLEGADASYGVSVHYRASSPIGLQPAVRANWTTRGDVGISRGYNDFGLMAGLGYVRAAAGLYLRAEILVGYEHLLQDRWNDDARHTSGFDYLGLVGIELPTDSLYFSLDGGAGGRVFQVIGKGWVHRVDFQASLSIGWKWGTP